MTKLGTWPEDMLGSGIRFLLLYLSCALPCCGCKLFSRVLCVPSLQVGVPAFLAVWEQLPYWNILPPILRRLPFAIPAIDAAYGFWARRRLQLTGRVHALGGSSPCRK
eukprot:6174335-Pleurochrysis_carterae.AAC.2